MKGFLMPSTTLTTLKKIAFTLLCCTVLMVLAASAQTPQQVKADPGSNTGPPAGAILDLNGTPIPGGGNGTYQQYTVYFTATLASTAITFAFRDDPAFISFANASVVDTTTSSGNLLTNGDFSGGTVGSTPIGWTYSNQYGATYGGVVDPTPPCAAGYPYCWYDGAVQAYDAISQTIATNVGDNYRISFFVADNSGCDCNFSYISTNGDTTDTFGNGIDVAVYAQAGLPPPNQQLTLTLAGMGTGTVTDNQGASGIGTCSEAGGVVTQTPAATPPAATGTCSANYPIGTVVTLTASATSPSTFVSWSSTTGACSGLSAMCTFTMNSAQNVTANFMAAPASFNITLPAGTGVTATAAIGCPSNPTPGPGNPCTDPNGVGAQLTIPQLPSQVLAMLTFTEIDPDGLCPAADILAGGQSGDFDCRFLTYSNQQGYGLDPNGNAITPLCYPNANGNCVVISLTDQNGYELPLGLFPQGVFLDFTFNNDQYTPTGYWAGSTPRLFIDPGSDEVTPSVPWGGNCSTTPMDMEVGGVYGTSTPTTIYCQFDADITTYYNPLEQVDTGIGSKLPASGTDFVVAFKPTNIVAPPSDSAPIFTSANSATFTAGTYGSFSVTTKGGYPAPSLSIAPLSPTLAVPAWLTLNPVGLLSGTPPAAAVYYFTITATSNDPPNSYNVAVPQSFTLMVGPAQYLLTTAANPPSGGTVSPGTGNQTANSVVTLTATPAAGYVFSSWTGPVANPSSASTTVTMGAAESVTANFVSALTVAPSTINFGTVYLGTITTKTVTVTNTGTTPITMNTPFISIVQGQASAFVVVSLCPKSLAGGSHCTITVSFVAGPYYTPQTATLKVMDNAPGNPQPVTLNATVINPQASFNPSSLSFGTQTVNTSVTKTVTLKNTGATTLSSIAMTVTGTNASNFTLTPSSNCGSSLTAGSSCTISVTFKPVAKVSYSATLKVTDSAQSGTQTVPLSGTGH